MSRTRSGGPDCAGAPLYTHLGDGDCVRLTLDRAGGIVLRPARRTYKLADLVSRITPKNRHGETDWGRPAGEESW